MKHEKIKIVFFSFGILEQGGGFENFLIQTASELVGFRDVFEVTVVTTTPQVTERLQKLLSIYYLRKHEISNIYRENYKDISERLGGATYIQVSKPKELLKVLNSGDFVYSKNEILELTILKLFGKKLKSKLIVGIHTPIFYPFTPSFSAKLHNILYTGKAYKYLLNRAIAIKVNTSDDKEYIEDTFQLDNAEVVHHAFNVVLGRQKKNTDRSIRLAFIGRITEQKGIDVLIKIVQILDLTRDRFPFKLKIVGSGEPGIIKNIKDLVATNSNIEYVGHVEFKNIKNIYDWTDLTLIPSKYETLNKIAVETAIAGKIAISSDIPGPREVIKNAETGFLLDLDPQLFSNLIKDLFELKRSDRDSFYSIGLKAQKKIHDEFSPKGVYEKFYDQLLSTGNNEKS